MKVSAISMGVQPSGRTVGNNFNNKVSFGYGVDYNDDDFLAVNDYQAKDGSGSVVEYFKLLGQFVYELFREHFCEPDYSASYDSVPDNAEVEPETTEVVDSEEPEDVEKESDENFDDKNDEENVAPPLNYSDFNFDDDIL